MRHDWQNELLAMPKSDLINESIFYTMKVFNKFFPSSIIQVLQYSQFNHSFSGILSLENDQPTAIAYINESMEINGYVHHHLLTNKVSYLSEEKFILSIGNQFNFSEPIKNMLLIPFSINGVIVAFMTAINIKFTVLPETLQEITKFSDLFMHLLELTPTTQNIDFTNKELIVMQYISNGYTTKEISYAMNTSESTIKYFIKNVMLKTHSDNRTEAVSTLFRMKLLD